MSADGASVCGSCGAVLNNGTTDKKMEPPYNGAPYIKLSALVSSVESGLTRAEEADIQFAKLEEKYSRLIDTIRSVKFEDDVREAIDEEYRYGLQGTLGLLEAVQYLRQWLASGEQFFKDRGLAIADSSTNMLNRAVRLNCESCEVLMQTAEDLVQQTSGMSNSSGECFSLMGEMNIAGF